MNISTFARRAGISPSGVRWYEAAGVLPSPVRRENGYREYSDADLSRLTLILALRRLGLTPVEAGRLVDRCLEGEVTDPALTATLEQQRRNIARQREELERLEVELVDLERTLEAVDRGQASPVPIGVLFVCNGNSARSQIAEALLDRFGDPDFGASSAGTSPKEVHPLAVRVLAEIGIDWQEARAKPVTELLDRSFDYVDHPVQQRARGVPGPARPAQLAALASRGPEHRRRTRGAAPRGVPRDACRSHRPPEAVHRDRETRRGNPPGRRSHPRERSLTMQLPYAEPLTVLEPSERVVPEPPRRGEDGGEPCGLCAGQSTAAVWQDEHFSLHPPVGGSLAGAVWLASREHVDSFSDLSPEAAAAFGPLAARVERAILGLGDVGRVHLYRWGDGGAHFHVWFIPRPLGMLEASGMMLPLWEDVLPNVSDEELADAARRIAQAL